MEDIQEKILEGQEQKEDEVTEPTPDLPPVDTSAQVQPQPQPQIVEENGMTETSYKTFTQDEVNDLVGDTRVKTREKTFRYIYDRYGVNNEEELDQLVANAQRFDTQKEAYDNDKASWEAERDENGKRLNEMSEQIALMQSDIDPNRYEDAKLILKGKGMEVTLENIQSELATHPEWGKAKKEETSSNDVPTTPEPTPTPDQEQEKVPMTTTRIRSLGNETKPEPQQSEEEMAEKFFKLKFH